MQVSLMNPLNSELFYKIGSIQLVKKDTFNSFHLINSTPSKFVNSKSGSHMTYVNKKLLNNPS